MKKYFALAPCALACMIATSAPMASELTTSEQQYSYAVGLRLGTTLQRQDLDVDPSSFAAGITDGISGTQPKLSDEQMQQAMAAQQEKQRAEQEKVANANLEKGQAFLKANQAKPGVTSLPSGLQYEVLEAGKGESPSGDSEVTVHYRGTLIDGTEFDSSYGRGEPASFPLKGVIKGFGEALSLMKPGAKWKVAIPADLAYGPRGNHSIAPNETLIFELELISFKPQAKAN